MIYPTHLYLDYEAIGNYIMYIPGAEMPVWFEPLMWTYLGIVLAALLVGLFVKNKGFNIWKIHFRLPSFLIGLVGFSYMVIVVLAVIVAAIRTGDYFSGIHQIGYNFISLGFDYETGMESYLLPGYWTACAVGPAILILAILRNFIVGKAKDNA
jgi:hypothetical protein